MSYMSNELVYLHENIIVCYEFALVFFMTPNNVHTNTHLHRLAALPLHREEESVAVSIQDLCHWNVAVM